jgi:peptidoglycan lytic transglycosylase
MLCVIGLFRVSIRMICLGLACALVAGCAETELLATLGKDIQHDGSGDSGVYKVGDPYQVNGKWYYPAEDPYYDEVGIASWYGDPFDGRRTANGEIYDMNLLTAAHKTLPMPVFVRVTNLDNGRSLVLKVNDRGPFAHDRIIDVSRRSAQLLGFEQAGTARVRVQVVDPDSGVAYARQDPEAPPEPTVTAAAVDFISEEPASAIYVQAGAFTEADNAQWASQRLATIDHVQIYRIIANGLPFYRVRLGPYTSLEAAGDMRYRVMAAGFPEARIVMD